MAKKQSLRKAFYSQSKLIQIILLLIPGVNWICELIVRWSKAMESRNIIDTIMALIVTIFGLVFGWVDLIWLLLFDHLLLG